MNLIFAGTPEFAARALAAIIASKHVVSLVLTRADKQSGRGMDIHPSPVKALAAMHGITVRQPVTLKDAAEQQALLQHRPDALVVAAYGLILPQAVLDIPRLGAFNIHASLLPRWRGAAPIQRAILSGDAQTGISIMRMDAGLDTGPVLFERPVPIGDEDTAGSLHDRLAALGAESIVDALDQLQNGSPAALAQDQSLATYAPKLQKAEARIDWMRDAASLARQVRAFNPAPGCSARLRGGELKIWMARAVAAPRGVPGEVLQAGTQIIVACGEGGLRLDQVQRAGARRLSCEEFQRGFAVNAGERFE